MAISRANREHAYKCKSDIREFWRKELLYRPTMHKFKAPNVIVHNDTGELFSDMVNGYPPLSKGIVR